MQQEAIVVETKKLWEILVPTVRRVADAKGVFRPYRKRFHKKVWDPEVRKISGGLTIMMPVKGEWVGPGNELFSERMIPVRFIATEGEAKAIAVMTARIYDQKAVLCYLISDTVMMTWGEGHAPDTGKSVEVVPKRAETIPMPKKTSKK